MSSQYNVLAALRGENPWMDKPEPHYVTCPNCGRSPVGGPEGPNELCEECVKSVTR